MLAFMGNCLSSWKKGNGKGCKKVTLAIFGLDNAGKTVTAKSLQGVPRDMVAPTVGFDSVDFRFLQYDVTMFDLGGGVRIRDIWKNYLAEIYGVVFVVDSSEPERMEECRQTLTDLLQQPRVAGKPILLLANKQDKPGALDEIDICEYLNLEDIVNKTRCPCQLKTCAALPGDGKRVDPTIAAGLKWLLTVISKDFTRLEERVGEDMEDQRKREGEERKARQERVRRIKEQREKEEAIKRATHGEGDRMDDGDNDDNGDDQMLGGDPFKRLDLKELKEKEKKQKMEKKRRKEEEARREKEEVNIYNSPLRNHSVASDQDRMLNGDATLSSTLTSPRRHLLSSELLGDRGDRSTLPPVPKSRSLEAYGSTYQRGNLQNGTSDLTFNATHAAASVSRLEPLESEKKKKKKRNQTVPRDDDNDGIEGDHSTKLSLKTTPTTEVSEFSQKWGLMDELPSFDGATYNRPNCENDEDIVT